MNLGNIIGNQISGIGSDEIEFLNEIAANEIGMAVDQWTGLTNDQMNQIKGIDDEIPYPDLSIETLQELENTEKEYENSKTREQTQMYVNKFKSFLKSENLPSSIESMPEKYLCQYLRLWYSKTKKQDGSLYAPSSMICMRAAIQRYLKSSEVNRSVDIIHGIQFSSANKTLTTVICKYLKTNECTNSDKKKISAIDKEDLKALNSYFDRSSPQVLQDEVFFLLMYHFGYRGREWIRGLTKSNIHISQNSRGIEYVDLSTTLSEKNVKGSTSRKHYESFKDIVMYSTPENPEKCPVEAVKLYLSKIPTECSSLFPKPLPKKHCYSNEWYSKLQVIGKHTLHNTMKRLSENLKLNKVYTNHCVRATVVTEMNELGYRPEEIQSVTGHKRIDSVQRYIKRTTDSKKQKISRDLSASLHFTRDSNTETTSHSSSMSIITHEEKPTEIFRNCSFSGCSFTISKP